MSTLKANMHLLMDIGETTINAKNPRTSRLLKLTGQKKSIRLLEADRNLLKDLARVGIVDTAIADRHHYSHLKNGSERSLSRLESAGLIKSKKIVQGNKAIKTYTFSSKEIARAWGGNIPNIGARRMDFHELVTAKVYFELGKPDDFRLASQFTRNDELLCGESLPDAMYTSQHGEIIFVEADSGHYSKTQVQKKMRDWSNFKQVWGQPSKPHYKVRQSSNVNVINIGELE